MSKYHTKEKKYHLADFFRSHWDKYVKQPKEYILPEQFKAVNNMLVCRTPRLGIDIYHCDCCDKDVEVYHSCMNRFCPTCGYLDTQRWTESILSKMIDRPHHHVTVMLPSAFRDLAKLNRKIMYSLLMQSASEAFKNWFKNKWNIEPGIMSVLHTFGSDLKYHVHVHMLVTAGGIDQKTGKYVEIDTKKWFLDYNWFSNKQFRPIFEKKLRRVFKNGTLQHDFSSKEEFESFLDKENNKKWRMNIEEPISCLEHIVKYIGRYTRRACLSEYKITNIQGDYISFECKDYKNSADKKKPSLIIKTFHYRDFFPRLLQHVSESNFRTVRYTGLYHNINKNVPVILRKTKEQVKEIKQRELEELEAYQSPLDCPVCNKRMTYTVTLFDPRKRNRCSLGKFKLPDDYDVFAEFNNEKSDVKQCA